MRELPKTMWVAYDPHDKQIWWEFTTGSPEEAKKFEQLGFEMVEYAREENNKGVIQQCLSRFVSSVGLTRV